MNISINTSLYSRHVRLAMIVGAILCSVLVYDNTTASSTKPNTAMTSATATSVHEFTMKDIDGKDVKLADYKGKVLLVVNVASKCGYTPQYEGLQKVYEQYKDKGLVVLGFPANNFLGQEPGSDADIKTFCSTKYNVSFPMFAKISVKGSDIHPLYTYLTTANPQYAGDIKWNFNKFLVGKDGKIVARFDSKEKPEGEAIAQAIQAALK